MLRIFIILFTVLVISKSYGEQASIKKTPPIEMHYTSWVSERCHEIPGDLPDEIISQVAGKFNVKPKFQFRGSVETLLSISIDCYGNSTRLYHLDVHFEKLDGYQIEYTGRVFLGHRGPRHPMHSTIEDLQESLDFVVHLAIKDFLSSKN